MDGGHYRSILLTFHTYPAKKLRRVRWLIIHMPLLRGTGGDNLETILKGWLEHGRWVLIGVLPTVLLFWNLYSGRMILNCQPRLQWLSCADYIRNNILVAVPDLTRCGYRLIG